MQLLLVEDDQNKRDRIAAHLAEAFPGIHISVACSLVSGLRAATEISPDLVLLDMTLPNYDGPTEGRPNRMHAFGGEEFLRQAKRRGIATRVIVVTQFETFGDPPDVKTLDDISKKLSENYSGLFIDSIYYHASQTQWQSALNGIIKQFM